VFLVCALPLFLSRANFAETMGMRMTVAKHNAKESQMKNKNGLLMLMVVVAGITLGALAEQSTGKRLFLLRAGSASAELLIGEGTKTLLHSVEKSSVITSIVASKMIVATNRVVLEIIEGTNSISVQADELLSQPYTLSALAAKPNPSKTVYLLRTGDAIAELHVNEGSNVTLGSRPHEEVRMYSDNGGKPFYMTNGVLEVVSGTNSISVLAAEVIMSFEPK
jgi:hypothetical protein